MKWLPLEDELLIQLAQRRDPANLLEVLAVINFLDRSPKSIRSRLAKLKTQIGDEKGYKHLYGLFTARIQYQ